MRARPSVAGGDLAPAARGLEAAPARRARSRCDRRPACCVDDAAEARERGLLVAALERDAAELEARVVGERAVGIALEELRRAGARRRPDRGAAARAPRRRPRARRPAATARAASAAPAQASSAATATSSASSRRSRRAAGASERAARPGARQLLEQIAQLVEEALRHRRDLRPGLLRELREQLALALAELASGPRRRGAGAGRRARPSATTAGPCRAGGSPFRSASLPRCAA